MWYLCLRTYARPRDERAVTLDEHLVWMKRQHAAGNILFSGPSADRRMGMYVIHAASQDEAEEVAGSDPFTVAGDATYELIEWHVHQILGVGAFDAPGLSGTAH